MDAVSEGRLAQVYPGLADKVRQMSDQLAAQNIVIRVVAGLRTVAEQDELYAQGRTAPGEIVTNVKGGFSWHNFGLAVDLVPGMIAVAPWQPNWDAVAPDGKTLTDSYQKMVDTATALGLECGALWQHFKDYDHFQMNGRFPVSEPDDQVRTLFSMNSFAGVWDNLGEAATTT